MKPIICKKTFLSFIFVILASLSTFAQQTLWVGQSYTFDVSSSVMGITANMSWSTSGGYLSLSGSGFYRTITVTQYFSGTATVTCEWDYKLTGSGSYTHTKRQVTISCRDNQVSISPTSMTMSPGETRYVSYRHQYDNQYTSAANAYFQSSDPSICTVTSSGEVIAKKAGTAYINIYSKISSVSPYCKVTVRQVEPTTVSLPSKIAMTAGDTRTLTPTLSPSYAQTSFTWSTSNHQIATVSNGVVTAKKSGSTTITVKTSNGLTASTTVNVDKAKLTLSADVPSQLLSKETTITLSTSVSGASIYYTLDGMNPSIGSNKYTGSIAIDKKTTLKAYAVHPDYYDSDILILEYDFTDLKAEYMIPDDNTLVPWDDLVFTAVFNKNICPDIHFNDITLTSEKGQKLPYKAYILNSALSIVPDKGFENGKYKIEIPDYAIKAIDNNMPNAAFESSFEKCDHPEEIKYFGTGRGQSFIIKDDGSLWACGINVSGELGDGTKTNRSEFVKIMDDVLMASGGSYSSMAIKNDHTLWAWGSNQSGEVGDGTTTQRLLPKKIKNGIIFASGDQGHWASIAIDAEGNLWAWGDNVGVLGDGTKTERHTPVKILSDNIIFATKYINGAAINDKNELYMWGNNSYGQLLDNTTIDRPSPIKVKNGVKDVMTLYKATVYLDTNGDVWSCGNNDYGQLGTGNKNAITSPCKILSNVRALAGFCYGGFAVMKNNDLYGWGFRRFGFWDSYDVGVVLVPRKYLSNVEEVKCGEDHVLIKKTDGSLWGVGHNNRLGLGDGTVHNPVCIFPGSAQEIKSISPVLNEINIEVDDVVYIPFHFEPSSAGVKEISAHASSDCVMTLDRGFIKGVRTGESEIQYFLRSHKDQEFSFTIKVNVIEKGSGVEAIAIDERLEKERYYNLNGFEISPNHLNPGIYIRKKGRKIEKVVIR